jgi:large subunit ribosomal protein L6
MKMSRIGRMPVAIPAGVTVTIADGNVVTVKGGKGTLERALPVEMEIKLEDNQVIVTRPNDLKKMKSLHGLTRTLIHNMVVGVSEGYQKVLEVNGVGYKAAKQGKKLVLSLGYSHPVEMRVSVKKKLANTQLKSERRENRSLTRARVLSMLMK